MVQNTFGWLQYDLEEDVIEDKIEYSEVDKVIIAAHGRSDIIHFDLNDNQNGYVSCLDINEIVDVCNINILDIHACNCGNLEYDEDLDRITCIACEFAQKEQIKKVYAWFGTSAYSSSGNYCYSLFGSYRVFTLEDGEVIYRTVVSSYGVPWQFALLEY